MKSGWGDKRLPQRFWDKVQPEPNSGCWLWTGSIGSHGYGQMSWLKKGPALAHRLAYQKLRGKFSKDLELDHLCRTRCCVNPEHLEPVTRAENYKRSPLIQECLKRLNAFHKSKTHCPSGHEYNEQNTRVDVNGHRVCRACKYAAQVRYRARRRA